MAIEDGSNRSTLTRRGLMAAAVGGVAVFAAQALGRAPSALAGGGAVQLGDDNPTNQTTSITNSLNAKTPLVLESLSSIGIASLGAVAGVYGIGQDGPGVFGTSVDRLEKPPVGPKGAGVSGLGNVVGVRGESHTKAGVYGSVGAGAPKTPPPLCGVYGWSTGALLSYGVFGRSTAPVGYGIFGTSKTGTGVQGFTEDGVAIAATAGGTGRALAANGPVEFSTSGLATVDATKSSKLVDPGIPLGPSTRILCTLMGNAGGTTTVERVAMDGAADTFTIHLTAAAVADVDVAWFVIG